MAKQTINVGTAPNDRTGDPLRTAFNKVNENFSELYTLTNGTAADLTLLAQDYAADMFVNEYHNGVTVTYDDEDNKIRLSVNIDGGNASTTF